MKRNSIIRKATAVTTISEWHREYLSQFNKNIFLIYNGFDSDLFYPRSLEKTDKFTITYTGSVAPTNCEGSRNIDFLFKALASLAKEKAMTPETFSLDFYTDDSSIKYLIRVAEKYDIKEYISVNEWLPFEKIPKILLESNILLVLLAEKNTNGIMTTKLYEYLAMNREILCIPNIESPVCEFIRKANSGNCFDNVDDIVEYLKQKYEEWKKTGIVRCEANFEYVQQFSRKRQAEQFVGVFNNSIK
jgi:glycosyltransferase involved in cell wall biosynthesis